MPEAIETVACLQQGKWAARGAAMSPGISANHRWVPRDGSWMVCLNYLTPLDGDFSGPGHWGNRTMVAAATIVSMAATKKAQQNVFALYHTYNRAILSGFIRILASHFKNVLVLRRRYLIPIRCNNGKRKCGLHDGCTILISAPTMVARVEDDGCIISGG